MSPFHEDLVQETLIRETAGSLFPGLAGPLTSLQLTHTVHHPGTALLGTHMSLTVGIPMQHQAGSHMHHLVGHLTSHHLTYLRTVHRKLKQFPPGRLNSQVQHLAEGASTIGTHMLHCSETHATDDGEFCPLMFLSASVIGCGHSL